MQGYNVQHLLEMLTSQNSVLRTGQIKKIKYKPHQFFHIMNQYQSYSQSIKQIFHSIFYDPDVNPDQIGVEIKIDRVLNFPKIKTQMPICNKRLVQRQIAFRCYDCMTHQASILCQSCFQNGDHKGHRYNQMPSGGGNCDCGNPDAIKKQGFCKNHPGKAEPVQIGQTQFNNFQNHFMLLFNWFFRLYEKGQYKSADQLGQIIAVYLISLNQQSLHYNTITYKFLYSKGHLQPQQIIYRIFEYGIKCVNFAKKMTTLFFSMFSLQIFKYKLTVSYCKAYNKYKEFQKSKFKQLYIQLYANNELIYNMVTQQKIVLMPYSKQYDYQQYIQNLMFLSTIKQHVAAQYFAFLMSKTIIKFPQLDQIQYYIQHDSSTNHLVNILNQNLNKQNSYYTLHQSIVKLLSKNDKSLSRMLINYLDAVLDFRYSYVKNKVVQPFHKVLSMIILAIFNGNLQSFSVKKLVQYGLYQDTILKICQKTFRLILKCYSQFALTYLRDTYLDSYVHLYMKSGNTIVIYDQIMFKICLMIFKQTKKQTRMNSIINQVFGLYLIQKNLIKQGLMILDKIQMQKQKQQKKNLETQKCSNEAENGSEMYQQSQQWQDEEQIQQINGILELQQNQKQSLQQIQTRIQQLAKRLYLIKLIIQNCISKRAEVKISSILQIQNKQFLQQKQRMSIQLLNNFKYLTSESIKLILRNFFEGDSKSQQKFIQKYLIYDKNTRKYMINTENKSQVTRNKLPLSLLLTLKKIGSIFTQNVIKQQQAINQFTCSKQSLLFLNIFFNSQFLKKIIKLFTEQLISLKDNIKVNNLFLDFYQTMNILRKLLKQQNIVKQQIKQQNILRQQIKQQNIVKQQIKQQNGQIIEQFLNEIPTIIQSMQLNYLNDKLKQKTQVILRKQKQQLLMKKFNIKKAKKLLQMNKAQQNFISKQKIQEQQIQQLCLICHQDNQSGICVFGNINYSNILQVFNNAQGRSLQISSCFHPIHYNCFLKSCKNHTSIQCPLCNRQSNIILPSQRQVQNFILIKQIYDRILTVRVLIGEQYSGYDKKWQYKGILALLKAITSTIGKNLLQNLPLLNDKKQRILNTIYNLLTTVFKNIMNKKQIQQQTQAIENFLLIVKNKAVQQISVKSNYYACEYLTLKIFYLCLTHQSDKCSYILCDSIVNMINRSDVHKIWQMCNQLVSLPEFKLRQPQQGLYRQIDQMHTRICYYQPPRYIKDLIQVRDSKQMSCKSGHQMCICIICKKNQCLDCSKVKQHFKQFHCNQGISFNLMTGGFIYILQNKTISIPSSYFNTVGTEWKPSKSPQGFQFDYNSYNQLTNQILKQSLFKYLLAKYPDLLKKSFLMDNIF